MLGALCTAKPFLGMCPTLVRSELACCLKCHLTLFPSGRFNMRAWERLLVQMGGDNVLLKSGMLAEGLVAWRILGAAILVSSVVGRKMTPKSRARHKTLAASWAITDIISNLGMCALDVVVEMRRSQEGLITVLVSTPKNPFIVM